MATTRASVRVLVKALVAFDPETYLTEDPDLNQLIDERADAFAIAARAFSSRITAFIAATATPGPLVVDLRSFGSGLTDATDVWVDGRQLYDLGANPRPGPCSAPALADAYPSYVVEAPGVPRHWSMRSPDSLELWPAPSVGVTVTILGTGLHGPLLDDASVTRFPTELDRDFAFDVAAELLLVRASGETLERAVAFRQKANAAADAYALRAQNATEGRMIRGLKRATSTVRIGR